MTINSSFVITPETIVIPMTYGVMDFPTAGVGNPMTVGRVSVDMSLYEPINTAWGMIIGRVLFKDDPMQTAAMKPISVVKLEDPASQLWYGEANDGMPGETDISGRVFRKIQSLNTDNDSLAFDFLYSHVSTNRLNLPGETVIPYNNDAGIALNTPTYRNKNVNVFAATDKTFGVTSPYDTGMVLCLYNAKLKETSHDLNYDYPITSDTIAIPMSYNIEKSGVDSSVSVYCGKTDIDLSTYEPIDPSKNMVAIPYYKNLSSNNYALLNMSAVKSPLSGTSSSQWFSEVDEGTEMANEIGGLPFGDDDAQCLNFLEQYIGLGKFNWTYPAGTHIPFANERGINISSPLFKDRKITILSVAPYSIDPPASSLKYYSNGMTLYLFNAKLKAVVPDPVDPPVVVPPIIPVPVPVVPRPTVISFTR